MNKTIIELREEAIKEDKNPEFYLYQKLEEKDKEIERLSKEVDMWNRKYNEQFDIINELEKWAKENNVNDRDIYGYEMEDTKVIYLEDFLDKLKELKEGKE